MDNKADQPSSAPLWLAYLAKGGTMKELCNMGQSQLDAMYRVAFARFNSGKFNDSSKIFRNLCLLDHTCYPYFLGLGLSQYELSRFAQSLAVLKYAEGLAHQDSGALLGMARCYMEMQCWFEAEGVLKKVLARSANVKCDQGHRHHARKLLARIARQRNDGE